MHALSRTEVVGFAGNSAFGTEKMSDFAEPHSFDDSSEISCTAYLSTESKVWQGPGAEILTLLWTTWKVKFS
jgi:hypothetical protein